MRWFVFFLLLFGVLCSASALSPAPAGQAGLFWPFAHDSRPILDTGKALTQQFVSVGVPLLAGIAGLCFLTALVGLFWKAIPANRWSTLVMIAVITSLPLYAIYIGEWMVVPILVDVILLWGILTNRWSAEMMRMRTIQNPSVPIHPLMHIPVPWMFILSFLAGLGIQYLAPITLHSAQVIFVSHVAGIMLTLAGLLLALSGLKIFSTVRTTTIPFEKSTELVTWGPYRFTRNPMYLGLTLLYLGEAGFLTQVWPLLLLPLTLLYIDRIVIPVEEAQLQGTFGNAYEQYCEQVRRWI